MRYAAIRYYLFVVLACLALVSCGRKIHKTTVTVYDTVIVEASHKDTIVSLQKFIHSSDTIYMHKERLTVQVWHEGDEMKIEGDCAGDTIYREIKVPIEIKCPEPTDWQALQQIKEHIIYFSLFLLIAGIVLGAWFRRK